MKKAFLVDGQQDLVQAPMTAAVIFFFFIEFHFRSLEIPD